MAWMTLSHPPWRSQVARSMPNWVTLLRPSGYEGRALPSALSARGFSLERDLLDEVAAQLLIGRLRRRQIDRQSRRAEMRRAVSYNELHESPPSRERLTLGTRRAEQFRVESGS
jgi:hypothetical protein